MDQNDINKLRGKTAVVGLAESGCGLATGLECYGNNGNSSSRCSR